MARRRRAAQVFAPVEREAQVAGFYRVAGLDEAGRGPLAGPVVAAAVVLPAGCHILDLRDSKCLTPSQRDAVYRRIQHQALAYGIGMVSHTQIDQRNILWATQEAMLAAFRQLSDIPDLLLIDGITALPTAIPQRLLIGGDARCTSIAAASVLAKVTRDRLMVTFAEEYPSYGFDRHKGYPTAEHYARLRTYGPCAIHRRSFRGVVSMAHAAQGEQHA